MVAEVCKAYTSQTKSSNYNDLVKIILKTSGFAWHDSKNLDLGRMTGPSWIYIIKVGCVELQVQGFELSVDESISD